MYWFDSCGVQGDKYEECGSHACADAACQSASCPDGFCNGTETQCSCAQDCGTCAGCCNGSICEAGTAPTQCGKNGAACTNCSSSGKECLSQACVTVITPTWTDPNSGLEWQNPPADSTKNWSAAKQYCDSLSLDSGGWHLPTIGELRTLIRGCPNTQTGGTCSVEEGVCLEMSCLTDSCNGCGWYNGPGNGCFWLDVMEGSCFIFWSSSPVSDNSLAWIVAFQTGDVTAAVASADDGYARCVR